MSGPINGSRSGSPATASMGVWAGHKRPPSTCIQRRWSDSGPGSYGEDGRTVQKRCILRITDSCGGADFIWRTMTPTAARISSIARSGAIVGQVDFILTSMISVRHPHEWQKRRLSGISCHSFGDAPQCLTLEVFSRPRGSGQGRSNGGDEEALAHDSTNSGTSCQWIQHSTRRAPKIPITALTSETWRAGA